MTVHREYVFKPSKLEILLTESLGYTLLQRYYTNFVTYLGIKGNEKVLDYCSGSGFIAKRVAHRLNDGQLIYGDISSRWLKLAEKKLWKYKLAKGLLIHDFTDQIEEGGYDKIIIHYALHDFPADYRMPILKQLIENLNKEGILFIREPVGIEHGMQICELINLLEKNKELVYEYNIATRWVMGAFIDVRCWLKP
ncbi:MAG: Methyltransferase type 12 [Anaerosolibacter sp.]|jgi:SAM-dependent methyltransferase|uniref:class I SAM-dependent methyltransferase n=1 Tax=Anaerosolibacter sp. TaxID=1872527 RepID=UPI00261B525E|nr:class I SAM-dependent methyltransferase [Anaerosolibacter sp.]MDF2545985.1 Methyltransferase type 12 [Anaerosolibacter sp.]